MKNDEKREVRVSLGTGVVWFLVVVLLGALAFTIVYFSRKTNEAEKKLGEKEKLNTIEITNTINEEDPNEGIYVTESTDYVSNRTFIAKYIGEFKGTELSDKVNNAISRISISFANNKFTADLFDFKVNGTYTIGLHSKVICEVKSYSYLDENNNVKEVPLEHENWTIEFEVMNDNLLKVSDSYFGDDESESEIQIMCWMAFENGKEYKLFEQKEKDVIGKWNSKYYINNEESNELKDSLSDIFGSSIKYGSYFELLDGNKFNDCVYPVTEGNMNRHGTYTYSGGSFRLKYDDSPSKVVNLVIVDENHLVYIDDLYLIVLEK